MNITRVGGDVVNIEECKPGTFVRLPADVEPAHLDSEMSIQRERRQAYLNTVLRKQERGADSGTYVEMIDDDDYTVFVSDAHPFVIDGKRGAWVDFGTQVEIIREP